MPRRHPSHQTGTAAVRAFQSALPKAWTFDTPDGDNDYGIDGSVRLFTPDGEPMLVGFDVQIKGTDEADLKKALRLSFDVETLGEYLRHDRPVLLVRYHEPTGSLYVKWSHRRLQRPIKSGQKTTTVYWAAEDRWTDETPDRLLRDTLRYRMAVDAGLPLPVTVRVRFETGTGLTDQDVQRLRRAFRAVQSPVVEVELSTLIDTDPFVEIVAGPDGVAVNVAGVTGTSLDLPPRFDSSTESEGVVSSALILVGLCLDGLGHVDAGGRLVDAYLLNSSAKTIPSVALQASRVLLAADRAPAVSRYGATLLDDVEAYLAEDRGPHGLDAVDALLWMYRAWAPADRSDLDDLVARRTSLVEAYAPADVAASALMSHAAHLRTGVQEPDRNRRALTLYNRARRLDARLCLDPDFLAAVAGVLYDLIRYRRSADFYVRAIELGADTESIYVRYGDALLMSGWFEAAAHLIGQQTSADPHSPQSLWILKRYVAERLAAEYGGAPERDQSGAARWVPQTMGDSPAHADAARAALRLDPLNVSACHNLGLWHRERDETERAAWLFARIAVVQPGDARAWADAFFQFIRLASSGHPDDDLHLVLLTDAALSSCERPFLKCVHQILDENGDDAYTEAIEKLLDNVRTVRSAFGSALVASG